MIGVDGVRRKRRSEWSLECDIPGDGRLGEAVFVTNRTVKFEIPSAAIVSDARVPSRSSANESSPM